MNKPRVFLSHSKKDIDFIHKIDELFRKCNIETWLDEIDIQHGESWLKAIFDEGISKCDFVLVYISENSIVSSMVEKEIDASVIAQLRNNNIKLLPYISNSELRKTLRLDLQAIQMPELNSSNFEVVFPIIVANILSNFMNQIIARTVKEKDLEI